MLSTWPIRYKLLLKFALLAVIVTALTTLSMVGLYSYRNLVKSISNRSAEFPLTTRLSWRLNDLNDELHKARESYEIRYFIDGPSPLRDANTSEHFGLMLQSYRSVLDQYRRQLKLNESSDGLGSSEKEQQTVRQIDGVLDEINKATRDELWIHDEEQLAAVQDQVVQLERLTYELPTYLHDRMRNFADEVRVKYRSLIFVTWGTAGAAALLLIVLLRLTYRWVFQPFQVLLEGSRRVAGGDFDHRIQLTNEDEMAELGAAMNGMTERFQVICTELDRQVQDRTREVVRSEQLASVGFLAAGVAHEINNPLASIAMGAESLESQLEETDGEDEAADSTRRYLQMIQREAFRCKEITEKLLDFSRMGDVEQANTDLRQLIEDVIEMVSHLGNYRDKTVELLHCKSVIAPVNAQEMKQVVLNLITNGLDSTDAGGRVTVSLQIRDNMAEIIVADDGCGMTEEVKEHLFEPFFTRRRSGQGTGLGLSIVFRIVADHDGHIEALSEGPGLGSRMRVTLPLAGSQKENDHRYQAA
ncbi:MAG: sensor histidine kinase [Planctomycetota bacterium]|mgnify:CR=1 FL=1|nr:MAG: sensor histidine kinase [Planctomycetota bacterium]REK39445.1 MAG: sensor histidine kinase [Planctomycetota bacterium]